MLMKNIDIIGIQMDLGAVRKGVDMGPLAIRHTGLVKEIRNLGIEVRDKGDIVLLPAIEEGNPKMRYEKIIYEANNRLYQEMCESHRSEHFPIVLGGDHCIAAGSVPAAFERYDSIGIIWIDAHGDYNDEVITPSGNMHGMPLSAVCGQGPECMVEFCDKRVNPNNVAIIGARALDSLEKKKLERTGVTVFTIADVHLLGIRECVNRAIEIALKKTEGIHLSFDMDAIDPAYAPGVGTPVSIGISQREAFIICESLSQCKKLVSMDFVETNPLLDNRNKTGVLARDLIVTCLND